MIVYLAWRYTFTYGSELLGVFRTVKAAQLAIDNQMQLDIKNRNTSPDYEVESVRVLG